MTRTLAVTTVALLASGCAGTATTNAPPVPAPKRYVCVRTDVAPVIDGRLDDPAWAAVAWTDEFTDIEGDLRPRPRFRTRAMMTWDDRYFYVAARLDEPHVWGALTEHDQIVYHDNDFEVFIDPDGDTRMYYEVEINALETIFDLFLVRTYIDGGPALHDWDLKGLLRAVHVEGTLNDPSDTDTAWTVELALPWSGLRPAAGRPAPPNDGDTWRVNFSRVQWRHRVTDAGYEKVPDTREDNWVWTPQHAVNMHLPEHWGFVEFRVAAP